MYEPKTIKPTQNYMIMDDYIKPKQRLTNFGIKKKNLFMRLFFKNKYNLRFCFKLFKSINIFISQIHRIFN